MSPPPTRERPGGGGLGRDGAYVAAGQLVAVTSGFLLTVVGARLLPTAEFGSLSWALSWLTYLAVLAQFGLPHVVTIALAGSDRRSHRARLRRLLRAQAVAVVLAGAGWWLVLGPVTAASGEPADAYRPLVLLLALWLPAAVVGPFVVNALRAGGSFGLSLLFGEHVRRVVLVAVLGVGAAAAAEPSLTAVLWWTVGVESLVYAAGVLVLLRVAGRAGRAGRAVPVGPAPADAVADAAPPSTLRQLRHGAPFVVGALASVTVPQAGVWLLALVASVEEVAVFAVAVRIALLLVTPSAIAMRTLAPRVARATSRGELDSLQEPVRVLAVWSTAGTTLAVVVFALTGSTLLPAVFGAGYGDALAPALALSVGAVLNAWTGPCSVVLSHAGHEAAVATTAVLSTLTFFVLAAVWAPAWGGTGVAAAASVAMSARNLFLAREAGRRLGLRTIAVPARRRGTP